MVPHAELSLHRSTASIVARVLTHRRASLFICSVNYLPSCDSKRLCVASSSGVWNLQLFFHRYRQYRLPSNAYSNFLVEMANNAFNRNLKPPKFVPRLLGKAPFVHDDDDDDGLSGV